MWIALKLLASGALEAVLKVLSAALQWLLSDWRTLAAAGSSIALAWTLIVTIPNLRADLAEAETRLADEEAAHLGTVNAFLEASRQARREAEANVARVTREQEIITDATLSDLAADHAALRARFDRLRRTSARTDPGRTDAAGLPDAGNAPGRAAAAPGDHHLPAAGDLTLQPACPAGLVCLSIDEAQAASEDAHRHNRLIDWVIAQSAVRFNPEVPRDE